METLYSAATSFLVPERARRWVEVLRKGEGYARLTPFEFLDPARRRDGVEIERFHSWCAFSQAALVYADREAVALVLDPSRQKALAGTCGKFVQMLLDSRIDAWIVARDCKMCVISTHERDLAVLRNP
ncbi:MAG: hypothetical protein HYZ17_08655 [Betaproteobacteria bacterium]|nr:hypothetical protein [Betaproteobacteria bacterium]